MIALLIPQLLGYGIILAIIVYSTRRTIAEMNAQTRSQVAKMTASTVQTIAEVEAERAALRASYPTGVSDEPDCPVRVTFTVRPGSDDPAVVAAVRSAVEAGLRDHLAPEVAAAVEVAETA
ncbi:MAG: hypothetical protein ACRC7O_04740 [Fimbriiglobus sp.]